jgi:hypothetical protein
MGTPDALPGLRQPRRAARGRGGAPLHRRPDLPRPDRRAPEAFRQPQRDGYRGAGRGEHHRPARCRHRQKPRGYLPAPRITSADPAVGGLGQGVEGRFEEAHQPAGGDRGPAPPPLERFLFGLGIRRIGAQNAKLLARHYQSIEHWREKMLEARPSSAPRRARNWAAIQGIGPSIATELVEFFKEPRNLDGARRPAALGDARAGRSSGPATAPSPARPSSSPARWRHSSRAEAEAIAEGWAPR